MLSLPVPSSPLPERAPCSLRDELAAFLRLIETELGPELQGPSGSR